MRHLLLALVFVGGVGVNSALAITVIPTDYDTWSASQGTSQDTSSETIAGSLPDLGTLDNEVFYNSTLDLYTYVHTVNPEIIDEIDEFETLFSVSGFVEGGMIVGWDFDDSDDAGGSGNSSDFTVNRTNSGRLEWGNNFDWSSPDAITFFFVSTKPPVTGTYRLHDGDTGNATSFAPAPEPGTLALMASGLVFLFVVARRRIRNQA